MRNLILLIFIVIFSTTIKAQESDLVDTFWYLREISIDGTVITPPNNDELETPFLEFLSVTNGYTLVTCVCYCGATNFVQFGNDFIQFDGMSFLITDDCDMSENNIFQDIYFVEFFQSEMAAVSDPIGFDILTDSDGNKQLTLTNSNGDIAVYGDQLLGIDTATVNSFSIATNPVNETLRLILPDSMKKGTIKIYDLNGKLHFSATTSSLKFSTDVSSLNSGMYLVEVADGDRKSIKKFIKI
ncbi:T9SS type A sorting domain-containing protein [Patiriisocius marinus]|uniref:Secretion system C-terminal sorting domain-containing protein n=1 Tax=Patiriisocius marinus TaxID=1397112 RepID=A0A5J4J325_9FLAO|nr:T9SS type A sorting domain-containing protein [Patiriisocius marinus]GER60201.1 hypothetical protein ULMA_23090 [Patiriisocius marinus]